MPYAELPFMDRTSLFALACARWDAIRAAKPDLSAAIALQRTLIAIVLDLSDRVRAGRPPRLSLPPRYLTTKLSARIPALSGEPIPLPLDLMQPACVDLVGALAAGGGGEATMLIRTAIEERRVDTGALLTLAMRREQGLLRTFATRAGLGHDLLWLVCDLATSPFAHALLATVFGDATPGSPLRGALDNWNRGYCPLCGTWPAFAEHRDQLRRLRCSFCAAAWDLPVGICVYCSRDALTTVVPDDARPARLIETCASCRGYTKVLDEEQSLPFPLLAIADLDSMDLDLLAMQRGAARPAIRQFARR